jgi:hypothetical protein
MHQEEFCNICTFYEESSEGSEGQEKMVVMQCDKKMPHLTME